MIRNEYRRAFIMLRAAIQGYGGHVRLERRTLTGNMYFIVTAPQGVNELSAALVGQQNGEYYAAPIGPLARDRRGQLALAWQFDPRSIDGRPLEAYAWVAVAATGGPCAVALTGNVEGARPMDLAALSRAVCGLFEPVQAPAADLPEPDAPPAPAVDDSAFLAGEAAPTQGAEAVRPEGEAGGDEMQGDVRIYTRSRARLRPAARRRVVAPSAGKPAEGAAPESAGAAPDGESAPVPAETEGAAAEAVTAARRLGLDITKPWPEAAEPLRRVFATQAPLEVPLGDGYTYVSCPMPSASGLGPCIVGLKADGDGVTAARYAVPGRRSPEPPAGLEGYRWVPAVGEDGYWVMDVKI